MKYLTTRLAYKCLIFLYVTVIIISFILQSCSFTSDPAPSFTPVEWILVYAGIVDSATGFSLDSIDVLTNSQIEKDFFIQWQRVPDAEYYEIRVSDQPITSSHAWEKSLGIKKIYQSDRDTQQAYLKLKPSVIENLCSGCRVCISPCPQKAIKMILNRAVINLRKCTGCGVCVEKCTYNAIEPKSSGRAYFFAIRAYSPERTMSATSTPSLFKYKSMYANWDQQCARFGADCPILHPDSTYPGCPVDAIRYYTSGDNEGLIYIYQKQCINCGNCIRICFTRCRQSIRKIVVLTP